MTVTQDFKCFIGLHKYEIIERIPITNPYNINIGIIIVSRCKNCGKIKEISIFNDTNYKRLI